MRCGRRNGEDDTGDDEADGGHIDPPPEDPQSADISVPPRNAKGFRHSLRALRHPNYAVFWSGALVSNTGQWLQNLTVPYVLFQLTHSALWVGLATLAQFLPGVLFAPVGGAVADRLDRRKVLLGTQALMAASAILLWAFWAGGLRDPYGILGLVAVGGIFAGVNLPSWQSFVHDLVPPQDLLSAVTLNSLQFNVARSFGPAVAGVLLAAAGPSWAFLVNAMSFCFVLGSLWFVRPRQTHRARRHTVGIMRHFAQSVRYAWAQPGIRLALLVSILVGLMGNPVFGFTVVFAGSVWDLGPVGLGLLNVALGLGAVVAAPVVSGWDHVVTKSSLVRWGLPVYGAAILAFAIAPSAVVGGVALLVVGGAFLVVISAANTAIQMIVAEEARGRVMAFRIMVYTACFGAGGIVQGWLSDQIGPRVTVAGVGALVLLAGIAVGVLRGRIHLDRLDDPYGGAGSASTAPA